MNYKTLVAASLMSIALTSAAFAQCATCAMYPDRDVLSSQPTPASRMMHPGGASAANSEDSTYNARADMRKTPHHRYGDTNASIAEGSAAETGDHGVYIKNLRDSGYSPAADFDAAGNLKVN